ncbi:hypothetical protein Afil01_14550 [Actinorhabdospora filicis]|uniref:Heavy-metal-associated domain-containing protein n=2 Tax=Actinorhabdospora filicis TaxID=1785913 RepID=A0A9W6SIJ3_9ACTN|nr:hypothetical protein Afil01_14550 [Actinorhabdospora filicis]
MPPRLPLYVGGVVLALLVGVGIGRVIGPVTTYPPDAGQQSAAPNAGAPMVAADGHIHGVTGGGSGASGLAAGGLEISAAGYTLVPAADVAEPGKQAISFRILRKDGTPQTNFAVVHEKPLHFFVVRRDFGVYRHLHPTMAEDGTWTVETELPEAGPYRMYADFTAVDAAGTQTAITLGADLTVTGSFEPVALPPAATVSKPGGLTVTMSGTATVGVASPILFTVDGGTFEPYLGAFGHLVALRDGDMGFAHVHPEPQLAQGAVKFWFTAPSPGTYRFYLDFQVGGVVHTADYVVVVA